VAGYLLFMDTNSVSLIEILTFFISNNPIFLTKSVYAFKDIE